MLGAKHFARPPESCQYWDFGRSRESRQYFGKKHFGKGVPVVLQCSGAPGARLVDAWWSPVAPCGRGVCCRPAIRSRCGHRWRSSSSCWNSLRICASIMSLCTPFSTRTARKDYQPSAHEVKSLGRAQPLTLEAKHRRIGHFASSRGV